MSLNMHSALKYTIIGKAIYKMRVHIHIIKIRWNK